MRTVEHEPEEEDRRTARGRQQLIAVAVTLIGSFVLLLVLGLAEPRSTVIWAVVFALLSFQIFRGRNWARWIVVALTFVLGARNAFAAASFFDTVGSSWPINAALVFVYAWCALILALSRPLQQFVSEQRRRVR